jgi:beta-galactosidase
MKRILLLISLYLAAWSFPASGQQSSRERLLLDDDWQFAFGNAASPEKDFGCGTEYFNYLTKAASIHNEGPYSSKFDASDWKRVNLPHDWVVDLPFAPEASHSHGYKTVGFRCPETSVGWYRKTFSIPASDLGRHVYLQFDGIFRDARVWVNGFYLGHEPSGYAVQVYNVTEYLNYGGDNLITVRADATLEEGWFYEGAGIYRHVWLNKTAPLHVAPFGIFVRSDLKEPFSEAEVTVETTIENSAVDRSEPYRIRHIIRTADGIEVARGESMQRPLLAKEQAVSYAPLTVRQPQLWSTTSPHLYTLTTEVWQGDRQVDRTDTPFGIRHIAFDADRGFLLNGEPLKLKGVNMHQDHAGVGAALPDALQAWRVRRLKELGVNAYRSSHNPMSPELLDICDREGILVIEENRLMGTNSEHLELLQRMIRRDRNHPSIILWSVGNEEWGIEGNVLGERIAASLREYCHRFDPSRPMTAACSGGASIVKPVDVAGYNYLIQNPIDQYRREYPARRALGSEETSGSGTRGIYFADEDNGHMVSLNRVPDPKDGSLNRIQRGWQFYDERPYLAGLFYWTGFDYRGEPNPMQFPATGSQFGILDYCGFAKDEAHYLRSWWTREPVLHLLPHWNLHGHEGDSIDVWVYSNCETVELNVNGKSLGRKAMQKNGYLSWRVVYQPGKLTAIGRTQGKAPLRTELHTTGAPAKLALLADRTLLAADNRDVAVVNITLQDRRGRTVPDACDELQLEVSGPLRLLGVGNGDPAFRDTERPADPAARTFRVKAFNGKAQVLLQSERSTGTATLTVSLPGTDATAHQILTLNASL